MHSHDCFNKFDEALKSANGKLAFAITFSKDLSSLDARLLVATEKLDTKKRKPVPAVVASYCPFCGSKLTTNEEKN